MRTVSETTLACSTAVSIILALLKVRTVVVSAKYNVTNAKYNVTNAKYNVTNAKYMVFLNL